MSSALAIASVTQVLRDLLNNGIIDNDVRGLTGKDVVVTCLPPDRVNTAGEEKSQLNLFMYMVSPNQGWRNQSLPSFNSNGDRITNPYLALDLHYLLSAYSPNELHQEMLLGYAMQLLFENAVLPREAIRNALTSPVNGFVGGTLPVALKALSTSGLADQPEMIKIIPETLNTEEISKLWTAFQTSYRPTTAYRVTVVLIESTKSAKSALPVQRRSLYVQPFKTPVISAIQSQSATGMPVVANQKILGYRLIINGTQLSADLVNANIDGEIVVPNKTDITDTSVSFALPADLLAGTHTVTINHPVLMGSPAVAHQGTASEPVSFVLCPAITITPQLPLKISSKKITNGLLSATLTFYISPDAGSSQNIVLLLNQYYPGIPGTTPPFSYSFPAQAALIGSPAAPGISVQISGVATGQYLMRIQVDSGKALCMLIPQVDIQPQVNLV